MAKEIKNVFIVNYYSEYIKNGIEKIHIEGFSGMQIDEKINERQFHSWDWKAKNKNALLAKISREFGVIVFKK